MKKILSLLLSITMLLSITAGLDLTAYAQVLTGSCGENVTYTLDTDSGVLTISGTGEMKDYSYEDEAPWNSIDCIATVVINSGVTSIGHWAFYNCVSLTSITIPNSVTSIGDQAFYWCSSLTSITIPNSVTSIGGYAFWDCYRLKSITIPNSVTSIGYRAFGGCDSLTSINVDGNNQNYSSQDGVLFNKAKTVLKQYPIGNTRTSYTIPNSVTTIGGYAFDGCDSLTSITIPNSVTSIGDWAFGYCDRLTSITIPNSVTSIGENTFYDCNSLTRITIPNSVTSIGDGAFYSCDNLTSITIPNSVTSIGYQAFYSCDSLTSITVDGNNQNYSSQDGVLFNKDKTVLIQYPTGNTRTSYTIPNSVTSIGNSAFSFCYSLSDVYYSGSEAEWKAISIGSYNEGLTNATIHYNSTGPEVPSIPETIKSQSFKVNSHTYKGKYGFYYTDDYFSNPSTKYNQSLATMSLCLALSTYQDEEKDIYFENVKDLFSKCGFDVDNTFVQKNYLIKPGTDTIGCSFVNKKIGDETLIAVAVRSGGYGAEWASNVTVGMSGDHEGFNDAATKVYDYLADYVNSRNITGKVKFWITGFSRGGATANLLAAKLDNTINSHPYISYDKEDVYAYTFATPAGANKSNNPHSSKYNNIFNIIHYHDVVPLVAPSQMGWGFDRYGITKVFSYQENSTNATRFEKHMKEYLKGMGYDYKVNNFKSYISMPPYVGVVGVPVVQKNNHDSLGTFNRKFIKSVATQIGTRHTYTVGYQTELRNFFSKNGFAITSGVLGEVASKQLINMLLGEAVLHPHLTATALKNYDLMAVVHSEDANYLAWMMCMDKNYDENNQVFFSNGDYRVVKVNCPVDVYVYDSSDNLVASIINEVPQDIEGSSIISSIDENEQKLVYLPIDSDYRVEVVAREDCQTTYTVNEFSGINADISKVVSYSEVDMQENESMISEIDAYSQDEIDSQEGATDGSTAEYTLELNNNLLSPNVKATGEDVENYTYNVQVSYDENQGEILGGGQFTAGDFCLLTATNKAGYMFEGWYVDNSKVSSEYSYRFAVKGDCTVEARFVPCTHQSYTENVVPPTYEQQGYTEYTCTVCGYTYTGNYVDKLVTPTPGPSTGGGGSIGGGGGGGFVPPTTEEPVTTEPTTQPSTKPTVPTTTTAQSSIKKPKSTSIKKLTKGTKSFKVTWKKKTGVSGYQVQYATDKKFKKNKKTVTVAKKNATSKTIKKLKSKKTYYVRVRTYKIVNGKKVYSSWSKVKAVKTK